MEEEKTLHITEIDRIASNSRLDMMKLALPYLGVNMKKSMTLLVKTTEIMNTMKYFQNENQLEACDLEPQKVNVEDFLLEIQEVCAPKEKERVNFMLNFIKANKFYSTYKDIANLKGNNNVTSIMEQFTGMKDEGNMLENLKNILTPEQKSTFDTVSMMLNNI